MNGSLLPTEDRRAMAMLNQSIQLLGDPWRVVEAEPSGPCYSVQFDGVGGGDAAHLVSVSDPDVPEIWNLGLANHNPERDKPPDCGMECEGSFYALRGRCSDYHHQDIFTPIPEIVTTNANASAYQGEVGNEDVNGAKMAYCVPSDRVRAPTISSSDGEHPENVRRDCVLHRSAQYAAEELNAKPGFLASRVPIVFQFLGVTSPDVNHDSKTIPRGDQPVLRSLWRAPGSRDPPATYQMNVQIFGANSSPSTCLYILNRTAEDNGEESKDVADLVTSSFYANDYLDSVNSEEEAVNRCEALSTLLSRGGVSLTKWLSSNSSVLASVASSERMVPTLDLDLDDLPVEKTLDVQWDCENDELMFKVQPSKEALTKRDVLSQVANLFDPLGLLAPVIISAKILLQTTWRQGFEWKQTLSDEILDELRAWTNDRTGLESLKLPRCLGGVVTNPTSRTFYVCCDASKHGPGRAVSLRTCDDRECEVHLVVAKTREAPIKSLTIPQLELRCAVVAVRLAVSVFKELPLPLPAVVFRTESMTALQWIHSRRYRFQRFVANRVSEILESTRCDQWRNVWVIESGR